MSTTNAQIESYFHQLVSELIIEIAFKAFQTSMTMTSTCPHCQKCCQNYSDKSGVDIYGNRVDGSDSSHVVECPCCKKSLAAVRFAPHLEKCMGMGRQSSRKRNIVKLSQDDESDHDLGFMMEDVLGGGSNEADHSIENAFSSKDSARESAKDSAKDEVFKKPRVSPTKNSKATQSNTTQSKAKPSTSNTATKPANSKSSSPSKVSSSATVKKATSPSKNRKK